MKKQKSYFPKDRTIIASEVQERDGIGVYVYRDNKLLINIFRDDRKKVRTVKVFTDEIELDSLEESIAIFKKEIPWDFD